MYIIKHREGPDFECRIEDIIFERPNNDHIMTQLDSINDVCDPMLLELYKVGYIGRVLNDTWKRYRKSGANSALNHPFRNHGCGTNAWAMLCCRYPNGVIDSSIAEIRVEIANMLGCAYDYRGRSTARNYTEQWIREGKLVRVQRPKTKDDLEKQIKKLEKQIKKLEKK